MQKKKNNKKSRELLDRIRRNLLSEFNSAEREDAREFAHRIAEILNSRGQHNCRSETREFYHFRQL